MALNIPPSLPPKKQTSAQKINEDEFEMILSILNDSDIGVEGGTIDETQAIAAYKTRAINNEQVKGSKDDQQDSLFDKARTRVLEGNDGYKVSIYTVRQGEDLRDISYKVYGDANAWVILAAANNITNPLSVKQIYPGRQLFII
jgi:nucleoid-associated protein YgaU